MIPSIAFLVAGLCMILVRITKAADFLDFHTAWAIYDVAAIVLAAIGFATLTLRIVLIFTAKH